MRGHRGEIVVGHVRGNEALRKDVAHEVRLRGVVDVGGSHTPGKAGERCLRDIPREDPPRRVAGFTPGPGFECRDGRGRNARRRGRHDENQTAHPLWMAQRHHERDKPAKGVSEDNWPVDAERLTEGVRIVGHLLDSARCQRRAPRAPMSPLVQIDDLGQISERREVGSEVGMIESRPAVQHQHARPLTPRSAIAHRTGSVDIEPQLGAIYGERRRSPWPSTAFDEPRPVRPRAQVEHSANETAVTRVRS